MDVAELPSNLIVFEENSRVIEDTSFLMPVPNYEGQFTKNFHIDPADSY